MEDWNSTEVSAWFSSLHPDILRHSGTLLPEEGCVVVNEWDVPYLLGKGLSEQDARRLIMCRDKANARAGDSAPPARQQDAQGRAARPIKEIKPGDPEGGTLLPLLGKGVKVLRVAVEKLGPSLPFPGAEAAHLVLQLLDLVEGAMANSANLVALRDRALALLDVLLAYSRELLREERRYKQAVDDFQEVLQHIVAYAQIYGSRNCVMRMLTVGRDAEECEALVAELRAVYERIMLAVAVDSNLLLQEAAGLLRQAAKVQDPGAGARALVERLGGMEAVKGDPSKMTLVMAKLDVATQITIEVVTSLLASHLDNGPQRHIQQAELRLLWKKLYPGEAEVPWFAWWQDFPARLIEAVPDMDAAVAEELVRLLAGAEARAAFQREVEKTNPDAISVWEIRASFSGDEALLPQIRQLLPGAANSATAAVGDTSAASRVSWEPQSQLAPAPARQASLEHRGDGLASGGRCQLPPLPTNYQGREEEAAGLAEHLRGRGSLVLLAGGGMGKSCLAADVGWRLVQSGEVPGGALWVDLREAFSSADVEARFCAVLGLSVEKEENGSRIVNAIRALAGPQQGAPGGTFSAPVPLAALVVVDNAEDTLRDLEAAEALRGVVSTILADVPSVRLLLTSRASLHLPSPAPPLTEHPVGAISPAAAAQLVQAVAEDVGEAEAQNVAEACRGVPLVLCLVAEALVAGRMTVQDLPKLLAASSLSSPADPGSGPCTDTSGAQVQLVLAGLKRQHQQTAAQLAVFPSSFDEEAAAAVLDLPSTLAARGLLAVLSRHSVVTREGWQRYSLHPLVREQAALLGARLDTGMQAAAEGRFVALMLGKMREWGDMYASAQEWQLALLAARERQADVGKLLELLARPPAPAAASTQQAAAAAAAATAAAALTNRGRSTEAEPLYWQALELRRRVLGEEHPDTVTALNNLAICINEQGRHTEAEPLYRQALDMRRRVLGKEHPDTAASVQNLAICIDNQGRYAEAERLYRQALELKRRVLGEEHPDTAMSLVSIAICIDDQGRHTEAEPLHWQALELQRRVLGEEHPETAASLSGLAICINDQGRHTEAEPLLRQALELQRRVLGEEHPATADSLRGLAICINDQGRHTEAEPLLRQALELQRRVLGEEHPETAASLRGLAICINDQGRHTEAEPLLRQALELQRRVLGEEHPETAASLRGLAICINDQGRHTEAEPLLRQALELQRRVLGEEHPETAASLRGLAICINDQQGRHTEAASLPRTAA
ncbi:hypothetical protein HYH03_011710 [Edaphochlamys debaryana]|uniref:Kinesin light chain n=1 Tax=Edaphochlamys debaryana TaxID=47281 RepID=A0A835XVD8_9CHLO|nr:hypothetical protein HYH03_011710 [Edaphochlamys debaryana]|eukprot:KAG2489758.1 hypothetical protein HYH03_011710 [Edaphochlamys debaryana]